MARLISGYTSLGMVQSANPYNTLLVGNVFFVGSVADTEGKWVAGVDNASQGQAETPFATINYAITQCSANNGDLIYVYPGHTEAVKAAGGITFGVAGVTVLGIGQGTNRPKITLSTATTATIKITAANCSLQNVYIDSTGIDAIAKCFDLQAAGFWLDRVEHYFAKTSYVTIKGLIADSAAHANGLTVTNCYFHGDAVANCTSYFQLVGGDSINISNNIVIGNFTTTLGVVNNITAALTNCTISNNYFFNATTSSTKAIVLLTGSTGFICNNRLQILSGSAPVTADGCAWMGNYYAATIATSGTLL